MGLRQTPREADIESVAAERSRHEARYHEVGAFRRT
jgi:hypothetical protein